MDLMENVRLELGPEYNKIYAGWLYKADRLVAKLPLDGEITRERIKVLVSSFEVTGEARDFRDVISYDAFFEPMCSGSFGYGSTSRDLVSA